MGYGIEAVYTITVDNKHDKSVKFAVNIDVSKIDNLAAVLIDSYTDLKEEKSNIEEAVTKMLRGAARKYIKEGQPALDLFYNASFNDEFKNHAESFLTGYIKIYNPQKEAA